MMDEKYSNWESLPVFNIEFMKDEIEKKENPFQNFLWKIYNEHVYHISNPASV